MPDNDILRLINGDSFLNYCLGRNEQDILHWENWLKEHPEQYNEINELRNLAIQLSHETQKQEVDKCFRLLKENINQMEITDQPQLYSLPAWKKYAAATLLLLSIGTCVILQKQPAQQNTITQNKDIAPGRSQATLTLANGQKVIITHDLKGKVAMQGSTLIQINADNSLSYTVKSKDALPNATTQYNTFSTARGEQSPFPLLLPDGSKVWLNAESSITFPTAFKEKERNIKITGEAYFDVIHDENHPFKVLVKGQTIEDLGTTFNINAYDDEPTLQTTLISGSIKVSSKGKSALIKPGQMAATQSNSELIEVSNVNTESAVAWKNGYFLFENEPLESVMRKVSRWYDVDIEYANEEKIDEVFGGSVTRYGNVTQVLKVLEVTGDVRFEIKGKKIIVSKK